MNHNNSKIKTNYIPRGKFDKNIYRSQGLDPQVQTPEFLGNFKDNFTVVDDKDINDIEKSGSFMSNYSLNSLPIPYSRQIFQPTFENKNPETDNIAHTNNYFKLEDPVFGAHGSNLNAPGSNQHKFPFNEIDLLEDSVSKLFKNITNTTTNQMIQKVELTHSNVVDDTYDEKNNMAQRIKNINEYEFKKTQFLDNNVRGVKEAVVEHTVYLNSADRNVVRYPNPFNYYVEFNPSNTTTNAYISKYFKNIRYMHITSVVIPKRYYVFSKLTTLIYDGPPHGSIIGNMTAMPFVLACANATPNEIICNYVKQQGSIVYYGSIFYFTYYEMVIDTFHYYICTYDIYIDREYKQKTNISYLNGINNNNIDVWLNSNNPSQPYYVIPNSYDVYIVQPLDPIKEINSWILIANIPIIENNIQTGNKIKFCKQDAYFEELIDQTFEFTYDLNMGIVDNTFKYYILMNSCLQDDRYLLLNIPEIEKNYEYATDDALNKSFCILFPDYINGDYYYLDTLNHEKVFDHSTLGNLSRMTIGFKNSSGNDLTIGTNIIDYDITTPNNQCICTYDSLTGQRKRNYQCYHSYMRHPSFEKFQNTIVLKLGILESMQEMQHI